MKTIEQLADEVIEACNLNACNCRATRGCRGTIIGAIREHGQARDAEWQARVDTARAEALREGYSIACMNVRHPPTNWEYANEALEQAIEAISKAKP